MTPESIILTAIAVISAIGSLLSLRSNNRRANSEAKDLEQQIMDRVVERADKELATMQKKLDAEIAARIADKVSYETEIAGLRTELHTERSARGILEQKFIETQHALIEAQQRISALEDERDQYIADNARKDARIKELESGTFPAVRPSGFGTK